MNIGVVGPGALGCLFSSFLHMGSIRGHDYLWLIDHCDERAGALNRTGITYEKDGASTGIPVMAISDPDQIENLDVLLLCVKSYDVYAVLERCHKFLRPTTLLVFLQNGIAHLDPGPETGDAVPILGVTTEGATLVESGHVIHTGNGRSLFGCCDYLDENGRRLLERFLEILNTGGAVSTYPENIIEKIWAKLLVNVGINGLTALHDCLNGELLTNSETLETMKALIDEATLVAAAQNISFEQDPFTYACAVCEATAANISSMLQDVRHRRKTEIETINGAIVAAGEKLGVPTPINAELTAKIRQLESRY